MSVEPLESLTVRVRKSLKERARLASENHIYRLSMTQLVERGIVLALAELEAQTPPAP